MNPARSLNGIDQMTGSVAESSLGRIKKAHIATRLRMASARNRSLRLIAVPVCLFLFIGASYQIEDWLLRVGFLNAKDIDLGESGTFYESLTNIWYWDGALFLLSGLAVLVSILVFILLLRRKTAVQEQT